MDWGFIVLKQTRKPAKSPIGRVVGIAAFVGVAYFAYTSGIVDRVIAYLPKGGGDHGAAELAASVLRDTPECRPYRHDILQYKGKPKTDATQAAIEQILEQGIAAGCKKSDLS